VHAEPELEDSIALVNLALALEDRGALNAALAAVDR
jgi:hypothetical protein